MNYELLAVERGDAIATLRLNRPEKHNALNAQLSNELIAARPETARWPAPAWA